MTRNSPQEDSRGLDPAEIRVAVLPGFWFDRRMDGLLDRLAIEPLHVNRRIKRRFDELGIEILFPHRTVYVGEAGGPPGVGLARADREGLKAIVREVLDVHAQRPASAPRHS